MAILAAEKRKAVADAKLRAIEQSILEERIWKRENMAENMETPYSLPEQLGVEDARSRTQSWVNAQEQHNTPEQNKTERPTPPTINHGTDPLKPSTEPKGEKQDQFPSFIPRGFAGNQVIYKPSATSLEAAITNQYIEGITHTNEKIVASLVRQTSLNANLTCFAEIRNTREKDPSKRCYRMRI
jgi:hypothetical protein